MISPALPGLLLAVFARATLLLAAAAAVERTALRRRGSAAARHLLWTFALGGVLLLPVLGGVLPGWRLPLVPADTPATLQLDRPAPSPAGDLQPGREGVESPARTPAGTSASAAAGAPEPSGARVVNPPARLGWTSITHAAASLPWTRLLLAIYLAGALLLLARVAGEQLLVHRLARGAAPLRDEAWSALLRSLAADLGVRRPVALLRSGGPTVPLTWGIVHPAILLPAEADEWPAARRRAVLVHELAHVARHDCLTQTLAAIACALYWPHPGVWWAARRLRVERELACDDHALARGIGAREYARHLLELARGLRTPRALASAAVSMASRSHLEMRLLAAIDEARVRTAPGRRATLLGAALTALLLLPLSAMRASAAADAAPRSAAAPVDPRAAAPGSPVALPRPAAMLAADTTAAAVAQQQSAGEWSLRLADPAEAEGSVSTVHVALRTPGLNTFYAPLGQFEGLAREKITSSESAAVRFTLRRDAGTFLFEGVFQGGSGTGRFTFRPDPSFADALARRGMARPTEAQQLSLARHGVGLALLDELAAQGYATPTTDELVRAGTSGADVRYLREMAALGYRLRTLPALVSTYNVGVDPTFVRELAGAGYGRLGTAELMRLRTQGIDADFIRRINASTGRTLSVDELVSLRTRGTEAPAPAPGEVGTILAMMMATPAPITPTSAVPDPAGFTPDGTTPTTGRWIISRARGGSAYLELLWDDDTQWRRGMELAELSGVSAGEVGASTPVSGSFRIEQDAGTFELEGAFQDGRGDGFLRFRPHRQFASTLRALGISGVGGGLTDHQLKNLAWGGMSAASVRGLRELGFTSLSLREVIDLAIRNVTPDYVRAMRALGVTGTETVDGVIELRFQGVTTAYLRELAGAGVRGLTVSQAVELWNAGVTADFVRRVRTTSPETLIQLKERRPGG